jgi:hypothetical protein
MSFCLSVSLPFCLSLSVFLSLSVCLYVFNTTVDHSLFYLSNSLSFCFSVFNSIFYNPFLVSTSVFLSFCLSVYLSVFNTEANNRHCFHLSIGNLPVCASYVSTICLSVLTSIWISVCTFVYLSVHLSVCLSLNILQSPSFIAPIKCFTADYLFRAATENSSKPHSTSIHSILRTV